MGGSRRSNRENRRRGNSGVATDIEFPGIMGVLQRNLKWFFVSGIVLLVASLGAPVIFSILDDLSDSDIEATTAEATAEATMTNTPNSEEIQRTYAAAPEPNLVDGVDYTARIVLSDGSSILIDLLEQESPIYVNNFVFLAKNKFFDGLTFHRVIEGFVAQGGDPSGTGMGGPGYWLTQERNQIYLDTEGLVSMAKSARGVSGSQFFITLGPTPWLTGDFTVFGRVISGMDAVRSIQIREPGAGQPDAEIMKSVTIIEE
jgi:peptidylprolyl isomerase